MLRFLGFKKVARRAAAVLMVYAMLPFIVVVAVQFLGLVGPILLAIAVWAGVGLMVARLYRWLFRG
jgi:hypothetical protein